MNKEKNFVSAVVYVHNSENEISDFLENMKEVLEKNFEHAEIICVNDASEDQSVIKIKEICKNLHTASLTLVNMSYFHGLEAAMNAGVDISIGDFVFEFDSTYMDFPLEVIMDVYRRSLKGYDIVSAVPNQKSQFSSNLFYKIYDYYTNVSYKMTTERFRILSRRVLNRINAMNKTTPYRKAVYVSCGLKLDSIQYEVTKQRKRRKDKNEQAFRLDLATDSLILFTSVGYSFAKVMTFLMMIMSVFMLAYSVVIYAMANPVAGWTTTILFLSVAFFGLFGILTIIIKYLQLLVDLVFKRKQYSYESIEKLTN